MVMSHDRMDGGRTSSSRMGAHSLRSICGVLLAVSVKGEMFRSAQHDKDRVLGQGNVVARFHRARVVQDHQIIGE